MVDHDEHVERAEGEGLHRAQVSSPDAGRVVCAETCATTDSAVAGAPADGSGSRCERSRRSQAHAAHQRCGRRPTVDAQWRCAGSAATTRRECGDAQVRDDSSSASRRAKQNDATAQPCPDRPSRACLASRTNRVPVVTRIGGRGDGAAVDDGPGCRRRADAAALSSRGRDLGGRGPKRRVLRQADRGRAQTSLSWLADTLLSQDRAAPIRFCRPTGSTRRPICYSVERGARPQYRPLDARAARLSLPAWMKRWRASRPATDSPKSEQLPDHLSHLPPKRPASEVSKRVGLLGANGNCCNGSKRIQ